MKNYYVRYAIVAFVMVLIVLGSTRVLAAAGRGGLSSLFGSSSGLFSADSATATDEPTGTAQPSETPEATEVDEGEDGEFFGTVEQISDTAWVVSGQTFLVTAGTEIDGGIDLGDTVKVEFATNADGSRTALEIETDDEDDAQDEDENEDEDGEFTGIVEQITDTAWIISGQTFLVTAGTEIDDGINLGDTVEVEFVSNADGSLTATEIETEDEDESEDEEMDDDSDEDDDDEDDHDGDDHDDSGHDDDDDEDHSGPGGDDD